MHKEASVQGRTTVVYIEADRTNALLMQFLLALKTNYALHHAADGLSGLALCRRVRPDLVITEMHLPDVTAYEVLRALRDYPETQGMPCVVLSGDAMPHHIERALAGGFDAYWTKPIDIYQLMQNIDDAATGDSFCQKKKELRKASSRSRARQLVHCSGPMLQN